ncbi:TolC family protein [bacterium SCSIO 12741]|nr:TolC family protein [bacterium SCSIO 12741]
MYYRRFRSTAKLILFSIGLSILCFEGSAQEIRMGILSEYESSPAMDSILDQVISEVDEITGYGHKVSSSSDLRILGISTKGSLQMAYRKLASNSDVVLLFGGLSMQAALQESEFKVPTIGVGIIDPHLQNIPYKNGASGVKNFTYIWAANNVKSDLGEFQKITPFKTLSVLVNGTSEVTFDHEKGEKLLDSLEQQLNAKIHIVPVNDDIEKSMTQIPPNTDAVYLSMLEGKLPSEIQQIADDLVAKGIPSFSASKWHVDNGILSCKSDKNDFTQVIRRMGIRVDEWLSGEPLEDMQVNLNFTNELFLNMETARRLEFSPPFEIIFVANLVQQDASDAPTYSLNQIMEKAIQANFDIKITQQDITLADLDIKTARSNILPNLELGGNAVQVNPERGIAFADSPEQSVEANLSLNQVIYSEEVIANIKISKYIQKAQLYDTEADVLQILLDTYLEYFNVLTAKTRLVVERENLSNFSTNLELARIRADLGSVSKADIYRWESEVASAKQRVVEAESRVIVAKYKLNTFLANSLEDNFDIVDIGIDDQLFQQFRDGPISQNIGSPQDLLFTMDFLVSEAVNYNPNKLQILENIQASQRQYEMNKRLLYTPTVALQAQTAQRLYRGGAGSEPMPGQTFNDNSWQVALSLKYPLYTGNRRRVARQQSQVQLEQLNYSRESLDQNLELAVRSNVMSMLTATSRIEFSRVSSENALKNFELIQNSYKEGSVSVTQLIDAQQSALQAKLEYAISVYEYIQSQLQLEYAVGFFSLQAPPEQIDAFEKRFLEFNSDN